jgi:hypothetical protein
MNIYPAEYEDVYQTYPITIVDAGASGGIIPLWKLHRRHLFIIGFEPDARAFDALSSQQNRLVNYFNIGLDQQSSEIPFYLTRKQENSSCYLPNRELLDRFPKPNRFDVIEETTLKCRALDEFLSLYLGLKSKFALMNCIKTHPCFQILICLFGSSDLT